MPFVAQIILPTLELDNFDLFGAPLTNNFRLHLSALDQRSTDRNPGAFADQEHLIELDAGALLGGQFLKPELVALARLVLFATAAKNRVHIVPAC